MHDSSQFNIKIDFERSKGSYIYDKNSEQYYLDYFGLYSSLPLGYNHDAFKDPFFQEEASRVVATKVPNCEIISDEAQEFLNEFKNHEGMEKFDHFHFSCTGALAIEAAVKTAIDQKGSKKPVVVSLRESFHGINSYGGFLTDRFPPVHSRLNGFPDRVDWIKIFNPKIMGCGCSIDIDRQHQLDRFFGEFTQVVKKYGQENIAAIVIEPIQSTYGDNYFDDEFFLLLRKFCNQYQICLIFDEIQTGFGTTGRMWYYQHTGIIPDIVVFGKKAQVSGIMVRKNFGKIFENPIRLEVTWDGDLIDMIRCKYILRAFDQYKILDNVKQRSRQIFEGLSRVAWLRNIRATGLLIAFDFDSTEERDSFFNKIVGRKLIVNKTREKSIRLRPNLALTEKDVEKAIRILDKASDKVKIPT